MHYSFFYFLSTSLIPELSTYITAGSSGNIHSVLICIAAVWALPHKLSMYIGYYLYFTVESAFAAIIAFRIKLGIHYIIINMLHYRQNGFYIILHIRNLNITHRSTRRQFLKLSLKGKLTESVNILGHMNMIAVSYIILICYTSNLTKSLL